MNFTNEERQEIKQQFYKVLNAMQKRTVFSEATYESMNNIADEFTNALYAKIYEIWEKNKEGEQ